MKIVCTQENLKNGLLSVSRIIQTNTTLPILSNILLETENGMLKISGTNLEIGVISYTRCKTEENGKITCPSKTLFELINNLPNQNISLESKEKGLEINTDNYHTSLKTLPAEEYPIIPVIDNQEGVNIDSGELRKAINQVLFAASNNQTQPEISGMLLVFDKNQIRVVATDRYRLAEKKINLDSKNTLNQEIIIPQKTAVELARVIGNQEGVVSIKLSSNQAGFVFNNTQIITRLIDGQYPPYQQIMPTEFRTRIKINKQELVTALKTSGIFSQNSNSVHLKYDNNGLLTISSETGEVGKNVVNLKTEIDGDAGEMLVNYHYVLDFLGSVDQDSIEIKIVNSDSPAVIVGQGDEKYTYLVMPIKS